MNVLLLQPVGQARGYQSKFWGTFNRWQSLGCHVMKRPDHIPVGQYGTRCVLFKPVPKGRGGKDEWAGKGKALPAGGNFVDRLAGASILARGARK